MPEAAGEVRNVRLARGLRPVEPSRSSKMGNGKRTTARLRRVRQEVGMLQLRINDWRKPMSHVVEATYENGVLKLEQPLPLKDHEKVWKSAVHFGCRPPLLGDLLRFFHAQRL